MLGQLGEAQRLRVADQLAEDAVSGRQRADPLTEFVVDADGEECGEPPVVTDDAQGSVLGVHQSHGGLHDAAQHLRQLQFTAHGHDGFQKPVEPVPGATHLVDTHLDLVEQLVQSQPWQPCTCGLGVLPAHRDLRLHRAHGRHPKRALSP